MATLLEVYETILSHALAPGTEPPRSMYLKQTKHGIGLRCGEQAQEAQVVLDPSAIIPVLRAFANRDLEDDTNPNGSVTTTGRLVWCIQVFGEYRLYLTDLILEKMRRAVVRLRKQRTPAQNMG